MKKNNFVTIYQTKNFRVSSVAHINKITTSAGRTSIKVDYRPLKEIIAVEQKIEQRGDENIYYVVAFVKWSPIACKPFVDAVDDRLKKAKGSIFNIFKRIELSKCIKKAKRYITNENKK